MKVQYKHKVMSTFMLWLDKEILEQGEAFTNHSGLLYDVPDEYSAYNTYGLPFKQIVSDTSISNASVMSGVTVDGAFTTPGNGDLIDINFQEGVAYFSAAQSVVSGDYAVKEYSISLTDLSEEDLLFENKFHVQNRVWEDPTGLAPNQLTIPHLFIKDVTSENKDFCFGGTSQTTSNIRVVAMSDDKFFLDGVDSICADSKGKNIEMVEPELMPFNFLGGWNSGAAYNYDGFITTFDNPKMFIEDVFVSRINVDKINEAMGETNLNVMVSFIDFELTQERIHRTTI